MKKEMGAKISKVMDLLMEDYNGGKTIDEMKIFERPNRDEIVSILDKLHRIVYPGYFKNENYKIYTVRNHVQMLVEDVIYNLIQQISIVLKYNPAYKDADSETIDEEARRITFAFFEQIPKVREYIETDVEAFYEGDPAAYNKEEIICTYPGLFAILTYRLAHELHILGVPLIPRIMTEFAHSETGIDIHPGTTIGKYFFIDHGTGIVIGETTVIGDNVKIYQGVTLGALSTRGGQELKSKKRHPTICDNVTIYSGASILGGETVVGKNVVIGGNAFITTSIPEGARVSVSVKSQEVMDHEDSVHPAEGRELEQNDTWYYMI